MARNITVGTIQMDVYPAPVRERLRRADKLVHEVADAGAKVVVLPELFNSGYNYSDANYEAAEPLDGPTVSWMRTIAHQLNIHIAGTLLLLDQKDVYNALLLFAPDGRVWRYDKNYPWAWERAYFRPGYHIAVARTDIGNIGLLICWDVAHAELWRRYAGRVDLMLICSCPPDVTNLTMIFPSGEHVPFDDMGHIFARTKDTGHQVFVDMVREQAAWLGVPAVQVGGSGAVQTFLPNGFTTWLSMVASAPWLARYLLMADRMQVACDMIDASKVFDASGNEIASIPQHLGESWTLSEVSLDETRPTPQSPQPASSVLFSSYLFSDGMMPLLTAGHYRTGVRRVWGSGMAPYSPVETTLMCGATIGAMCGIRRLFHCAKQYQERTSHP